VRFSNGWRNQANIFRWFAGEVWRSGGVGRRSREIFTPVGWRASLRQNCAGVLVRHSPTTTPSTCGH
jgi:hypothetical protein